MPQPKPNIDDYANNMFRFERLHGGWLDDCAAYLKYIFGARIEGATVVDYAFGRGNWSLAFLRAGAKRVIAIDASHSNVERLRDYCAREGVRGIDIRCGNVLEKAIDAEADILWLYGILPAIVDQAAFTEAVLEMVPGPRALVLAYGYDKHSLRECIVEGARADTRYTSEKAFRRDSLKFTPAGRMRARDDLTAPHVEWHTADAIAKQFAPSGFRPLRQLQDFRAVTQDYSNAEFAPHHILLGCRGKPVAVREPKRKYAADIQILQRLWSELAAQLSPQERRDLAISAFSTHFSHLGASGNPEESLIQFFLLLLYGLRAKNISPESLSPLAASMLRLGERAIADAPRKNAAHPDAFLVRYLQRHTIRI